MAHWTLDCPKCKAVLTHSEVPPYSFHDDFMGLVVKPTFPIGGLRLMCTSCGHVSVHQSYELIYRDF
jgi:hypothetical protein